MGVPPEKALGRRNWTPPWVKTLGTAVWISDPEGNISYLNRRAEALLGHTSTACIGSPCHRVVCGYDELGRPFCGSLCPILRRARMGQDIEPVRIRLTGSEKGKEWVQVLPILVHNPNGGGPYLVHCVLDEDRAHRIEHYLTRVATRSNPAENGETEPRFMLTRREREILDLLVEDKTLHGIAVKLNVSHATVRNHVQHILTKLGVHSTMEAVAYYLLEKDS